MSIRSFSIFIILFLFSTSSVFAQCFSTNLQEGDTGSEVHKMQHFLKKELSLDFEPTHYFGPVTKQAVISFQEKYRDEILTPISLSAGTGYWGISTYTKANTICESPLAESPSSSTESPLDILSTEEEILFGQTNDQVKIVQEILNKEVDANLPITGYFGPMTLNALRLFQEKYRDEILTPHGFTSSTGYVGPATRSKINQLRNNSHTNSIDQPVKKYVIRKKSGPRSLGREDEEMDQINPPINLEAPVISGESLISEILSVNNGNWSNTPVSYGYQWFRDGIEIENATLDTYTLNHLDFNADISVVVTATNSAGSSSATSTSIDDVTYDFLPVGEVAFVGDSITTYIGTASGNYNATGYGSQARAQTGSLFDFILDSENDNLPYFAVGGTRTNQHLETYFPAALAAGARVVVYHGGTNDGSNEVDISTALSNVEEMIQLAIEAESIVVLTPVMGPTNDATKTAWVITFNEGIEALAEEYNMPFADWRTLTEASPGISNPDIMTDNLHPAEYGAHQMGHVLATTLMTFLDTGYNDDLWASIEAGDYGEFLGTQNYQFEDNSGSRPTGFSISTSDCLGCTVTENIIARDDGHGNWWEIDITPTDIEDESLIRLSNPLTRAYQGTTTAATSTSITLDSATPNTAGLLINHRIWIIAGTGAGQTRMITGYSGDIATIDIPWVTIPDNTSRYHIGVLEGERLQFLAEVEILEGTDLRALGGFLRSINIEYTGPTTADIFSGGASQNLAPHPMELPARRVVLRGPIVEAPGFITSGQDQIRMFFGGDGTFRIGRFGVIGLDRRVGQTTFPLE